MGRDKALLELAGKPLIAHAVAKLGRLCADVAILSANAALAPFAPLVPDRSPGCGPLGGIDAALAHTTRDWCLIMPVDVPFLPSTLLEAWVSTTLSHAQSEGARLSLFVVDGRPQPALLLIHRDLAPYVAAAIARHELKLLPVLSAASEDLAARRNLLPRNVLRRCLWNSQSTLAACSGLHLDANPGDSWIDPNPTLPAPRHLYFANLNTPEDFAQATHHLAALET